MAPLVGALGNGALALSGVMTAGMAIALVALLLVGGSHADDETHDGNEDGPGSDDVVAEAVAEPA